MHPDDMIRPWEAHGHCYAWNPWVAYPTLIGDLTIAGAYFQVSLPMLRRLVQRSLFAEDRSDVPAPIEWLVPSFIFLCGCSHVMNAWTIFRPVYVASTLVTLATAAVSIATAFYIGSGVVRVGMGAAAAPELEDFKLIASEAIKDRVIRAAMLTLMIVAAINFVLTVVRPSSIEVVQKIERHQVDRLYRYRQKQRELEQEIERLKGGGEGVGGATRDQ